MLVCGLESLSLSFFFRSSCVGKWVLSWEEEGGDIAYFFPSHGVFEEGEMRQSLEVP